MSATGPSKEAYVSDIVRYISENNTWAAKQIFNKGIKAGIEFSAEDRSQFYTAYNTINKHFYEAAANWGWARSNGLMKMAEEKRDYDVRMPFNEMIAILDATLSKERSNDENLSTTLVEEPSPKRPRL